MRALATIALAAAASCVGLSDWPDTARPKDGVGIRYQDNGSGEPAIVFIHGWSCDRQSWTYQIPSFARARRVLAIDLAGHGESEGGRTQWTIEDLGSDVAVVCDDAEVERVVLVGHSMGALVALEAAAILGERCVAVVAVDALHDVDARLGDEVIESYLAPLRADFPKAAEEFVRQYCFRPEADKELVDLVVAGVVERPPRIAVPLFEALLRYDAARALARVSSPVFCIQSARKPTDVDGARKHNSLFDAVAMDGVGHFPMLEDPAKFNPLLGAYLAQLARAHAAASAR